MLKTLRKRVHKQNISIINGKSIIDDIKGRQTEELILALCGSAGSGTSTIANNISEIFSEYNYQ